MLDWSLPTPSHEKLEKGEVRQAKVPEPKEIPRVLGLIDQEAELGAEAEAEEAEQGEEEIEAEQPEEEAGAGLDGEIEAE